MSDEDRLRQRLREQADAVPVIADLDDVAARIRSRSRGPARSMAVVTAVALVVGTVAGFSVGRAGRGTAANAVVASAAGGAAAGTSEGPSAGRGGGLPRLFVRTTADGITVRAYATDDTQTLQGSSTKARDILAELSTDAAVSVGAAMFVSSTTTSIGAANSGTFGTREGAPAQWVIVQAGAGVARIRATFGKHGSDEMAPEQGVVALARLGGPGDVVVEAIDASGRAFARRTVSTAACDGGACSPGTVSGPGATLAPPITLPAPGGEQPADVAASRSAVTQAFAGAFDGAAPESTYEQSIEGGSGLSTVYEQLRHGSVASAVVSAKTVVDGIVFTSPVAAAVEFHSNLGSGGSSGPYFGNATRTSAGWQVTRASYCRIVVAAGAQCP